jgi:hypothetical protein
MFLSELLKVLPVGVQLVADSDREHRMLAAGAANYFPAQNSSFSIEVIWNACWKDDTPPAIPARCLVKSFVIFGVSSLPISC